VTTNTVTQTAGGTVSVTVKIEAGGKPCKLSTDAPLAATQSTTLGKGVSVPRNECITAGFANTFPQDCGYPQIYGANASSMLNATATIGSDGSSIILTAPAPAGFKPVATSYGRASWPRTVFYVGDLPVIPWYSDMTATDPWTPPKAGGGWVADEEAPAAHGMDQMQ
jgi:sialate O-acetylesterase